MSNTIFATYTLLFGTAPLPDTPQFSTKSGCYVYLRATFGETIIKNFDLVCVNVTPPMCQGKPCQ